MIYAPTLAISQVTDTSKYGIKIAYPSDGQKVPIGKFTIFGTAAYNATATDCTVYADWNNLEPMQKVMPVGPDYTELGRTDNDYSTWIFTYTDKYHLISEGANELTAKLSCTEPSTNNEICGSPNKSQDFADDIKNDPSSEVTGDPRFDASDLIVLSLCSFYTYYNLDFLRNAQKA